VKRTEAIEILAAAKGDAVSITTMRAVAEWHATPAADERQPSTSLDAWAPPRRGLGLALSQPDRPDPGHRRRRLALMQLGVLATIAERRHGTSITSSSSTALMRLSGVSRSPGQTA
jgi:hypothetical protein